MLLYRYPDRPDSLGGIEGGASPRLTEAYDFRGLHHVSDHHRGSVTQVQAHTFLLRPHVSSKNTHKASLYFFRGDESLFLASYHTPAP